MASQSDLAGYVNWVRGSLIDVDGWFGAQCWDQWSHYATNFLGVPVGPTYANAGGSAPHAGYACNVFHNAHRSGLTQWFDILPASATPQAGDVAFWEYGSVWYPYSHVATVLEPPLKGGLLRCLTQNPGAVQIANLLMHGLIGYLRPRSLNIGHLNSSLTPTLTASEKLARTTRRRKGHKSMYIFIRQPQGVTYAVFELGVKGSWWQFTGSQDMANALASQRGNAMEVLIDAWNDLKKKHS